MNPFVRRGSQPKAAVLVVWVLAWIFAMANVRAELQSGIPFEQCF